MLDLTTKKSQRLAVEVDFPKREVILNFGRMVSSPGFSPENAAALGMELINAAGLLSPADGLLTLPPKRR